eukprot:COSAG06_NODE_40684_length_399_cov_1.533333_1_plen_87_part_10
MPASPTDGDSEHRRRAVGEYLGSSTIPDREALRRELRQRAGLRDLEILPADVDPAVAAERFYRDGFCVLEPVLPAPVLEELRAAAEA